MFEKKMHCAVTAKYFCIYKSNSMSIETNWNFIIQKATADYYNTLPESTSAEISQQDVAVFLDYNALAKAVSSMKVKNEHLICGSGCKNIVRQIWDVEMQFFEHHGLPPFGEHNSAVKKIVEGLIAASKFANSHGDPLLINDSNLFRDDVHTNFFGVAKDAILKVEEKQTGGTRRAPAQKDWRNDWRKELTRRVSQSDRKK